EATMKAAEKAGFDVREPDGSWKPILISEPNAVLYDLAQKILNGEVAESVLDFSSKKKVLVFDIGGGTLDVTFHEIERDPENGITLNISEIAASRFTQLAGDDFDAAIADSLYRRCVDKFKENEPSAVQRICSREAMVKKMLTVAAEQLKIGMNSCVEGDLYNAVDDWFSDTVETYEEEATYIISHSIGDERIYNDTITKSEFEAMLEPFLGKEYTFEDYRGYSNNRKIRRDTIIAPILDVLEKAARHYAKNNEALEVDAVILNGGMSKLYLVKNRIKEFFNLEPITTADPDLSVANGAAVYAAVREIYHLQNHITIKRHVQNDDLYLGLSAGVNDLLISTGEELPYTKEIEGYRIVPGTQSIEIPIKRGEENSEPQTIARGIIAFSKGCKSSTDLRIEANFDQTGLLAIKAYLLSKAGVQIDTGVVEIAIGAPIERNHGGGRIIPVSGAALVPSNEIDALKNLLSNKNKSKDKQKKIEIRMENIINCGNPRDFEDVILRHLSENNEVGFRYHLYQIVDGIVPSWSEDGIKRLKEVAQRDIISIDLGFHVDERRRKLSEFVKEIMAQI
ncbi:MAG: Hsp70 family protein, partial [Eubacteriales bacterium]